MASLHFLIPALVLVLARQVYCQDGPTQITISPASLIMTPNVSDSTGGQVTVTCRASSVGAGEGLVGMAIERVLHTNPNAAPVSVAGARLNQNNGDAELTLQSLQATVSGNISLKSITLTLSRANCGDAGMYNCKATALTSGGQPRIYSNSANMTIEVSPGLIEMFATPDGTTVWAVNDTLQLRCNGIVGTVNDASQIEWQWEYQDGTAGFPNWQSYSAIGNPDTDIVNQGFTGTNKCYKYQISELTRQLTLEDTGRQYRCYVINRDVSSNSQDYAKVHDVGTVTEQGSPGNNQSPSTGDGGDPAPAKADVGAIVGGVIGALVVIIVIIVIVYFLVIRKRRDREPDPSKPADEQPPPGYTPDPTVTYSQPQPSMKNRFKKDDKSRGQANPGLDSSDEKPAAYDTKPYGESKPARYENDFGRDYDGRQGRRNQAYNYDDRDRDVPRSRRYSSDDGGTDTQVNTSQHSIGYGDPNLGTAI